MPFQRSVLSALTSVLASSADVLAQEGRMAEYRKIDSTAVMADTYIVHFFDCTGYSLEDHAEFLSKNVSEYKKFVRADWLPGYRASFDVQTLEQVRRDPLVEHDVILSLPDMSSEAVQEVGLSERSGVSKRQYQTVTTWGSYNQRMVWSNTKLETPVTAGDMSMLADAGKDVTIFVLDSGVRISHEQFQGRASNFLDMTMTPYLDTPFTMDDPIGHGTAVAGAAAGQYCGTASSARIQNVRVTNDEGFAEGIHIATAIHDVVQYLREQENNPEYRGGVINMSLSFEMEEGSDDRHAAIEKVVHDASDSGILIVTIAGNQGKDARTRYPCNMDNVLCVGATDNAYERRESSNFGKNVNVWAPGEDISTLWHTSDTAVVRPEDHKSGTSLAAPQICGIAAVFMSWEGLYKSDFQGRDGSRVMAVWYRMFHNALHDIVEGLTDDDNNILASTGLGNHRSGMEEPYYGAGPPALVPDADAIGNPPPLYS